MSGTIAGVDNKVVINKQQYELILAQLQKRGLNNEVAKMMAYDILIITQITGQSYRDVIDQQVTENGLNLTKDFIDQLNLLRSATNKLNIEDIVETNAHVARSIV
jgi:hypothetical protein